MTTVATAAAPPVPRAASSGLPQPVPAPGPGTTPPSGSGTSHESPRLKVAHWMESHFGRAYVPIAMAGGAVVGGGLGFLTLGPVGALAGGAAGALLGGVLVFAG
jgi:hypothetical protein